MATYLPLLVSDTVKNRMAVNFNFIGETDIVATLDSKLEHSMVLPIGIMVVVTTTITVVKPILDYFVLAAVLCLELKTV